MGAAHSSQCLPLCLSNTNHRNPIPQVLSRFNPETHLQTPIKVMSFSPLSSPQSLSLKCKNSDEITETQKEIAPEIAASGLVDELVHEALVWSSLHGLVVGDRNVQRSGTVPGVGMVHAPIALLPMPFPEDYWRQACELAPIFNELVDRVSLDGIFLQDSLSRTKKVDTFTSRLLDIHAKMLEINKTENIRLGMHRSDYMLDAETNLLFQIELNTISSSFPGLSCLVSELHRIKTIWEYDPESNCEAFLPFHLCQDNILSKESSTGQIQYCRAFI